MCEAAGQCGVAFGHGTRVYRYGGQSAHFWRWPACEIDLVSVSGVRQPAVIEEIPFAGVSGSRIPAAAPGERNMLQDEAAFYRVLSARNKLACRSCSESHREVAFLIFLVKALSCIFKKVFL